MTRTAGERAGTARIAAPHRSPRVTATSLVLAALLVVAAISVLAEGGNAAVAGGFAVAGAAGFVVARRTRGPRA